MSRIVVALGGNALGNTPKEQKDRAASVAGSLIGLIKEGHEIVVSHGNGPQVGAIKSAMDASSCKAPGGAGYSLAECTAMSQGYIGFHLQSALLQELRREGLHIPVIAVTTQVEVDPNDAAFASPSKPIGAFCTERAAKEQMAKNPSLVFREDSGRGWRKVVASPMPVNIVEKESILNLIRTGNIVIACGGGGIPVVRRGDGDYEGVDAVIDKDFASECLAELVGADILFILTAVDRVCIRYGKPDQEALDELTADRAEILAGEGHFAPGSMLPKVRAAVKFARSKPGRQAVIGSLEKASLAISGKSGTAIKG